MNITRDDLLILNVFRDYVAANAVSKGFRAQMFESLTREQIEGPIGKLVQASVYVANEHGEVSEFWEAFRKGTLHEPCDKAPKMVALGLPALSCVEEEVADIIIRALDTAQAYGVDVAKALAVKHAYNTTRPTLHGGKKA
jgi:NTP pyrophosphatase (non-canonical NTP hydrolase)